MVLTCEIGIAEGKPQMEQYGLDELAASADAVVPGLPPLAISGDGKSVAVLPEARRRRTKAPEQKVRTFDKRAGTGEKRGCKRMAETGCVFDVAPGRPRTPGQVMGPDPDPGTGTKKPPRAQNRWYACDITAGRDVTIAKIFAEADRRDPDHARTWIALVDGDNYQLSLFQAQAAARGITLAVVIDFIHVLGIPAEGRLVLPPAPRPRDGRLGDRPGLDILHGRAAEVIARIRRLAEEHPPRPGGEHARNIRKTLSYLRSKQAFMDYPRALAQGWPIATGVIEGACRHLIQDRMGITGARWSLPGAQAMLWLRAINPAATPTPTGTGTSPRNTSATTKAATRTASNSLPDRPHSKRAAPMRYPHWSVRCAGVTRNNRSESPTGQDVFVSPLAATAGSASGW
jgi:hypothetical protein